MPRTTRLLAAGVAFALTASACGAPPVGDAGPDRTVIDAAADVMDSPTEAQARPGCNQDGGFTCTGDYPGRCSPACAANECCIPRHGGFECAARDASGY